ncbi:hypothetical protein QFC19_000409 [Naganishia cerealis]|uniref:Uncharacterized protein n=1 Tax=Naganishia cerealis TaxID=610337 RepID=A0ACC2WM91_9TREE|nr:hypothetical protein QFC19_000409 [Naganishia cerealis]
MQGGSNVLSERTGQGITSTTEIDSKVATVPAAPTIAAELPTTTSAGIPASQDESRTTPAVRTDDHMEAGGGTHFMGDVGAVADEGVVLGSPVAVDMSVGRARDHPQDQGAMQRRHSAGPSEPDTVQKEEDPVVLPDTIATSTRSSIRSASPTRTNRWRSSVLFPDGFPVAGEFYSMTSLPTPDADPEAGLDWSVQHPSTTASMAITAGTTQVSLPLNTDQGQQPTVADGGQAENEIERLADEQISNTQPATTTTVHDIIIPARLFSVTSSFRGRRSAESLVPPTATRRSTAVSNDSGKDREEGWDVQRIAREQSMMAQRTLRERSSVTAGGQFQPLAPPPPLHDTYGGRQGSRTISFALPPASPTTRRFAGSEGKQSGGRASFKKKSMSTLGNGEAAAGTGKQSLTDQVADRRTAVDNENTSVIPTTAPLPPPRVMWANMNPFATHGPKEGQAADLLPVGDIDSDKPDHVGDGKELAGDMHGLRKRSVTTVRTSAAQPRPSHVDSLFSAQRRSTMGRVGSVFQSAAHGVTDVARRMSMFDLYEKAKVRGIELQRSHVFQIIFEWSIYIILLAFVYLVLVGLPIWKGAVYWLYQLVKLKFVVAGTWAVTIGIAAIYAFAPLFILFEKDPPMPEDLEGGGVEAGAGAPGTHDTALLIPCYKSQNIIGPTLEAALKIFPASHIFVIANGNSPTPLDDTETVCNSYGVNHVWSPVGSKIVAQFVGCFAAKQFKNDDDCALPPNFPIVSDRMKGKIKCIGYTIKSVGPLSSKGTYCQQAQDLEYKLSGLQRAFAGMIGSATFPHGAISIWNTEFLISTFHAHPGYSVSEDWFFGHAARQLGSRITMCTSTFVETETPSAIFFSSGGSRGGFGEMTVFKQRFMRWNFFFVTGMVYNMDYIIRSWKLGWWEFGAKLFVFQEVYETLLYLLAPFILPISLAIRPAFTGYMFAGVFGLYFVNTMIFNEIHLRLKNERIGWKTAYPYYNFYKMVLLGVNIASCYWSIWKYATYFAKRHPKIIEDEKAIDVVLRLEEPNLQPSAQGRRMTVAAIGSRLREYSIASNKQDSKAPERKMTLVTFGPALNEVVGHGNRERRVTAAVLFDDPSTYDPLEALKRQSATSSQSTDANTMS